MSPQDRIISNSEFINLGVLHHNYTLADSFNDWVLDAQWRTNDVMEGRELIDGVHLKLFGRSYFIDEPKEY